MPKSNNYTLKQLTQGHVERTGGEIQREGRRNGGPERDRKRQTSICCLLYLPEPGIEPQPRSVP